MTSSSDLSQKMATTLLAIISLVACAGVTVVAESTTENELLPAITVLEGQQADILCHRNVSLRYCRVTVPSISKVFLLSEKSTNIPAGFAYYGNGHSNGDCGITIKQAMASHDGVVLCNMGADDEESQSVPLTIAIAPLRPKLEIVSVVVDGEKRTPANAAFEINDEVTFKCVSPNGRPAAKLSWFLGEQPVSGEYVGATQTILTPPKGNHSLELYTAIRTVKLRMRTGDDGKNLTCRAEHTGGEQVAYYPLTVGFRPQPQPRRYLDVAAGETAFINVTVAANPPPNTTWIVDGERIEQGGHNGRFAAHEPIGVGNGVYNVTLSIVALQPEDAAIEYSLSASNQFGKQEYLVQLSATQPSHADTTADVSQRSMDMSALLLGVGAVAVLLAVAVLGVARVSGRCCFGRRGADVEESTQEKV